MGVKRGIGAGLGIFGGTVAFASLLVLLYAGNALFQAFDRGYDFGDGVVEAYGGIALVAGSVFLSAAVLAAIGGGMYFGSRPEAPVGPGTSRYDPLPLTRETRPPQP